MAWNCSLSIPSDDAGVCASAGAVKGRGVKKRLNRGKAAAGRKADLNRCSVKRLKAAIDAVPLADKSGTWIGSVITCRAQPTFIFIELYFIILDHILLKIKKSQNRHCHAVDINSYMSYLSCRHSIDQETASGKDYSMGSLSTSFAVAVTTSFY
jgi:hypothetical protein